MMLERELRYAVDEGFEPGPVLDRLAADGWAIGPATVVPIEDTYYETDAFDLLRAGLAVRRRCRPGAARLQLKALGRVRAGLAERPEFEIPCPGQPQTAAASFLLDAYGLNIEPARLQPAVRICNRRTVRRAEKGGTALECALDCVRAVPIQAGIECRFSELEFELVVGSGPVLERVATLLRPFAACRPVDEPKLLRALRLIGYAVPQCGLRPQPSGERSEVRSQRLFDNHGFLPDL
ncbi:MAG: CYTH domain-containing protein [Kiritimatiellae bacterium]|nr:CYTH domain-containing protein [Kiritimatiellia bacterium]